MLALNSTESIEGVWAVKLAYEGAEAVGEIIVQYQREEPIEYCNDDIEGGIPADSVECSYHNAISMPPITGSLQTECRDELARALELLSEKNSTYYYYVSDHLTSIVCEEKGSGVKGATAVNPVTGEVGMARGTWEQIYAPHLGIEWLSTTLVHEACHVKQHVRDGGWPFGEEAEMECLAEEIAVLKVLGVSETHDGVVHKQRILDDLEYREEHKWWTETTSTHIDSQ